MLPRKSGFFFALSGHLILLLSCFRPTVAQDYYNAYCNPSPSLASQPHEFVRSSRPQTFSEARLNLPITSSFNCSAFDWYFCVVRQSEWVIIIKKVQVSENITPKKSLRSFAQTFVVEFMKIFYFGRYFDFWILPLLLLNWKSALVVFAICLIVSIKSEGQS